MQIYYTVYKTTNLINGKIYIGCHKTKKLNDSYIGSGKLLKRAVAKYGNKNFNKTILFVFDNPIQMFDKEKEIVNEKFVKSVRTYNLKHGGRGGQQHPKGHHTNTKEHMRMMLECSLKAPYTDERKRIVGETFRKYHLENKDTINYRTFLGKKHSKYTKMKLSKVKRGKYKGCKNPSYNTKWICNLVSGENRKISQEENLPSGWVTGRNKEIRTCEKCEKFFIVTKSSKTKSCSPKCRNYLIGNATKKRVRTPTGLITREKEFLEWYNQGFSIAECLSKMGYKSDGGNKRKIIRKWLNCKN